MRRAWLAVTMLLLAGLLPGCLIDAPCTQTPTAASVTFPWNGTKQDLANAFESHGWTVEEGPGHQRLSLEKEVDGARVTGSLGSAGGNYPGNVTLTLRVDEPRPTTAAETEALYQGYLPDFLKDQPLDPLPSSRHCGAI